MKARCTSERPVHGALTQNGRDLKAVAVLDVPASGVLEVNSLTYASQRGNPTFLSVREAHE